MVKRVEALRNLRDNLTTVQERLKQLDGQKKSLKQQSDLLDQLRASLSFVPEHTAAAPALAPAAPAQPAAAAPAVATKPEDLAIVQTDANAVIAARR